MLSPSEEIAGPGATDAQPLLTVPLNTVQPLTTTGRLVDRCHLSSGPSLQVLTIFLPDNSPGVLQIVLPKPNQTWVTILPSAPNTRAWGYQFTLPPNMHIILLTTPLFTSSNPHSHHHPLYHIMHLSLASPYASVYMASRGCQGNVIRIPSCIGLQWP